MAGRVLSLADPLILLPDRFVVDTNLIVERLWSSVLPRGPIRDPARIRSEAIKAKRATEFFQRMRANDSLGVMTPTVIGEVIHVIIGVLLKQHGARQSPPIDGRAVYKPPPGFMKSIEPTLQTIRTFLIGSGFLFISPDQLRPVGSQATMRSA